MTPKRKLSAWQRLTSFPQSFSYEVDVPLEDVVQNLADLEQEKRLFTPGHQEVSILPRRDHYAFRMRRRRHGSLAATAEGEVWENDAGQVVIEGEARSNGGPMILVLIALLIPTLVFTMAFRHLFSVAPLVIFFAAVAVDFMLLHQDRRKMVAQIGDVIRHVNGASQHIHKSKRRSTSRLALMDETPSDIIDWDRVTQEAESKQGGHGGR